jgi:hypothetical protein
VSQPSPGRLGQSSHSPPGDLPSFSDDWYGLPAGSPVAPPKKSSVLKVVLITLAAALVFSIVVAAIVFIIGRKAIINVQKTAAKVSIVEPLTLGGRAPLTGPEFTAMTDVMEQGLTNYKDATNAFGALYGDVDNQDVLIAIVVERPVVAQAAALTGAFSGLTIGGMQIDGVAAVEPGPLGGEAQCGTADAGGTDIAVCGWADEGSIGILMWYFHTADQVIVDFPKLRAEIETKTI